MDRFDVAIAGGGPAGLCLARSLAGSGLSVLLADPHSAQALAEPEFDGREIALTHTSRALMEQSGLWQRLGAATVSPLQAAQVLDGHSPFALTFADPTPSGGPLGWLVPNQAIRRAAWDAVQGQEGLVLRLGTQVQGLEQAGDHLRVRLSDGTAVATRLLVAADSRHSATRRLAGIGASLCDFGKTMLVCRVRPQRDHARTAWEWFGHGRTMALLPLNDGLAGAVLTVPPQRAAQLLALDEDAFGEELAACFEGRLGAMEVQSTRHAYPLIGVYAQRLAGRRVVLVGDAAVGMHPVTAHGFNFGLQGQARLAALLRDAARRGEDIAAPALLARYQRAHCLATRPLYEATNAIARLYTDQRAPALALRAAALRAAAVVAPFRQVVARRLMQPSTAFPMGPA